MSRYYTQCLGTPSLPRGRDFEQIYEHASAGYLFHDTEGIKNFVDVHRAMWRLAGLYEGPQAVYAVRTSPNTIFASFSTSSIIKPIRVERWLNGEKQNYEWVERTQPTGWLVENIADPKTAIKPINYNDMYGDCLQLPRASGDCPCHKLNDGSCLPLTIGRVMPSFLKKMTDFVSMPATAHQVSQYREIAGFQYVPGLYCIDAAFVETLRPWDNYDFSLVPERQHQFKARGEDIARRNKHRKEHCTNCCFGTKRHDGTIRDCGGIERCYQPAKAEDAKTLLWRWFIHRTPFLTGSEGFTASEIKYLMHMTGWKTKSNCLSERRISVLFAGFTANIYGTEGISFRVVAARGNLNRWRDFHDYASLREAFGILPHRDRIKEVAIPQGSMLAYAVLATVARRYRRSNREFYALHYHENVGVTLKTYHHTKIYISYTYDETTPYESLYRMLWPTDEPHVNAKLQLDPNKLEPLVSVRMVE